MRTADARDASQFSFSRAWVRCEVLRSIFSIFAFHLTDEFIDQQLAEVTGVR